jgi:hypothetical protein
LATLKQARQVILTRIERCGSGHRESAPRLAADTAMWEGKRFSGACVDLMSQATSIVPEKRILEDDLSCNLHKTGASLIEKVVEQKVDSRLVHL